MAGTIFKNGNKKLFCRNSADKNSGDLIVKKSTSFRTFLFLWLKKITGISSKFKFYIFKYVQRSRLLCKVSTGSHPEVFWVKGVLKMCCRFIGEHPCRNVISIKLQSNFIEITLRHECSPVNLLHIFIKPFTKNTSERLLLCLSFRVCWCLKSEIPNSDKLSNN